jgi:hypothetical protein
MSKRHLTAACGVIATTLVALLVGEWLADPWRHWQPPAVELPVPNAFDDYVRAATLFREPSEFAKPGEEPADHPEVRRRVLAANAAALRALRAGFAHACVVPRGPAGGPCNLPWTQWRRLARVLWCEAAEDDAAGRYAAAIDCQLDAERLGFDVVRRADLSARALSLTERRLGLDVKRVQARLDHLTAAEARGAASRLAGLLADEQSLAQSCLDDRDIALAGVARQVRADGGWRVALDLVKECDPDVARPLALLGPGPWVSEYRRYMEAFAAWSELPWNAAPAPRPSRLFGSATWEQTAYRCREADAMDEMFLAALALQAWRAENGQYPDTLDALAPDILATPPPDPFGRGALRYRRCGERYLLYSVGPEGCDHGGVRTGFRNEQGEWFDQQDRSSRGDVVWPGSAGWREGSGP